MRKHELKTWPEYFKLVWSGDKPFEVRKYDRAFRVGDQLWLREYVERENSYTGREIMVTVTSIISGPPGVLTDYVIMGFDPNSMVRLVATKELTRVERDTINIRALLDNVNAMVVAATGPAAVIAASHAAREALFYARILGADDETHRECYAVVALTDLAIAKAIRAAHDH